MRRRTRRSRRGSRKRSGRGRFRSDTEVNAAAEILASMSIQTSFSIQPLFSEGATALYFNEGYIAHDLWIFKIHAPPGKYTLSAKSTTQSTLIKEFKIPETHTDLGVVIPLNLPNGNYHFCIDNVSNESSQTVWQSMTYFIGTLSQVQAQYSLDHPSQELPLPARPPPPPPAPPPPATIAAASPSDASVTITSGLGRSNAVHPGFINKDRLVKFTVEAPPGKYMLEAISGHNRKTITGVLEFTTTKVRSDFSKRLALPNGRYFFQLVNIQTQKPHWQSINYYIAGSNQVDNALQRAGIQKRKYHHGS